MLRTNTTITPYYKRMLKQYGKRNEDSRVWKTRPTEQAKILFKNGSRSGEEFLICKPGLLWNRNRGTIEIGRKRKPYSRNFITVASRKVSRLHVSVRCVGNSIYIINHSLTNPTRVNGIEINKGERFEMRERANVKIGDIEFQVKRLFY